MLKPILSNNSFYCSVGADGHFIDFSPRWTEFLGVGQVEILGRRFEECIHPDDILTWKQALDDSIQQRYPYEVEIRILGKNSNEKSVVFSILYLTRESRFIIFADDSAELREILRRQNTAKRLGAEIYGAGYWEYNLKSGEFFAELRDRVSKEIFTPDELINYFKKIHDESESSHIDEKFRNILDSNKKSEFILSCGDNNYNKFVVRRDHELNLVYGIIIDVSEQMLKEKIYLDKNLELNSFEKGLEKFTIVARTDAKGRITYANEAFCKISKYDLNELLGKDHRILNSGHHPKEFFQQMWDDINHGRNWRKTIKNKAKDGTSYWVDTIIIPIRNTDGDLLEILSFRYEVTHYLSIIAENKKLRELLKKE